jgi:PAS domain S-box-containing protein
MESLELNKTLLESSTDCIKVLDLGARLLFMNGGGCKALEIDDFSRIANTYWLDFWKGTGADAARAAIETAKSGGIGHFQGYCPTWKGTPKWWDVVITPILGARGKPKRLLVMSRDITELKQSEDALREPLQQLQLITENVAAGVTLCRRDLRYVWVSPSYASWLGRTPKEIAGRLILDVLGHEYYETIRPYIERVLSGERVEYEVEVKSSDAGPRWIHAAYVPTKGQDQHVDGWIAVVTDVTDRHLAEQQLRESEERFRSLADTAPVMIWLSGLDKLCTFFNKPWLDFTGRTLEQELGNGWTSGVHPDDLDSCLATYSSAFDARRSFQMEYRIRRNDEEYRWVLDNGTPLYRGGEFVGYIGSCIDISEQKLIEGRLRASEARLMYAHHLAKVGSWEREIDSGRSHWSDEIYRIFGVPNDALAGLSTFVNCVHPEDQEKILEIERYVRSTFAPVETEYRIIRPDGEVRWVRSIVEAIRNDQGHPTRIVGATQDITDVRHAQEESFARQKLESLGTLASGIAHDFNNFLSSVLFQAEVGLEECVAGLYPETELKAIRNVAIRGSEIIRQLMIYTGEDSEFKELVDVSPIVEGMFELLKFSVSKHARLEIDLGRDLPAVGANAAQLRQVVMNLVMNASDAIGEGTGVIRVATSGVKVGHDSLAARPNRLAEGDYVQLEVADTGRGIPSEVRTKVFDPFFTTKTSGHGLGLAIVDGIVRGLGGTIHLTSELGKGTTFRILLPSSKTTTNTTIDATFNREEVVRLSQATTILIVEDEDPLRRAVVKVLLKTGFEVFEASDGFSAIDLLREKGGKVDVLLLDMTIPGSSFDEVAAEAVKARPDVRIVLTSAHSSEKVMSAMRQPQKYDFIRKPFLLGDLVKMLHNVPSSGARTAGQAGTA